MLVRWVNAKTNRSTLRTNTLQDVHTHSPLSSLDTVSLLNAGKHKDLKLRTDQQLFPVSSSFDECVLLSLSEEVLLLCNVKGGADVPLYIVASVLNPVPM